jgi:MinD-like ATPase involved in chromosome partitioning or flagellar assembly
LKRINSRHGSRLAVTVESPSGRRLLDVPLDARMADLVPSLVEACEGGADPAGWTIAPLGEASLAGERTLGDSGLYPGALLLLVPPAEPLTPEPALPSASELARRLKAGVRPVDAMPQIDRMNATEYRHMLDGAITASGLGPSLVVAVMSAHAGAGTTTVCALAATLLSGLRRDQVVVVDACPQSGALSHWMAPDSGLSAATYGSLLEPGSTPEQVHAALVGIGAALAILPAPSDHHLKSSNERQGWATLIEHLRHLHHIVIVDCGAGFQRPVSQAALATADVVVLVSRSAPGDLDRLRPAIDSIRARGRTALVVANQAAHRARATRSAGGVQQVTLAHEPQPAHRLKTRGFSWSEAPDSWQEAIRELAAALIGSAQGSVQPKP